MADRYPGHVPAPLAEVLGMPPHALHFWWKALRDVGVDVPRKYEGEVAAALHFLIPFALLHGEEWRDRAIVELQQLNAGKPFRAATLSVASPDEAA